MLLQIFDSFFKQLRAFTEHSESSVAQMTQKPSYLFSLMAMIYMQLGRLKRSIGNRFITADKALVVLLLDQLIILFSGYPIAFFYAMVPLVLSELFYFFRVSSIRLKSFMMAYFAYIDRTAFHTLMVVKEPFVLTSVAQFASLGFVFFFHI